MNIAEEGLHDCTETILRNEEKHPLVMGIGVRNNTVTIFVKEIKGLEISRMNDRCCESILLSCRVSLQLQTNLMQLSAVIV